VKDVLQVNGTSGVQGGNQSSFMPEKRDLYDSLRNNQHPSLSLSSDKLKRIEEHSRVSSVDYASLAEDYGTDDLATMYAKIEIWAVLKIKMRFSRWLAELVNNLVSAHKTEIAEEAMIR